MKLEYTLTFADFKSAQRLHYRQTLGRRLRFAFWNICIPVLAVLGLAAFVFLDLFHIARYAAILFGIECALLWIAICNPIARYFKMRKCFKQLFPPTRTERNSTLELGEDHLLSGIPGVSEGKFFWNAIVGFAQDEKITLIYVAKTRFLFFPTAAMSPDQRAKLDNLIDRHVTKRQPC
jgi:hypothetical protein